MYECFHCGSRSVIWDADFDFSDYGLDGEGIVHACHCTNCGADITYQIRIPDEENEQYEDPRDPFSISPYDYPEEFEVDPAFNEYEGADISETPFALV